MIKYLRISSYIRKPFLISDHPNFLIYEEILFLLFDQCVWNYLGGPERHSDGDDPAVPHRSPRPICHHHLRHHRPRDVHGGHAQVMLQE